jgi:hypothetical protein
MKRVLLVVATATFLTAAALAANQSAKSMSGWVSDSSCGAQHAGTGGSCVKKCVEGGAKPVFVDDAEKNVWSIDNPDSVSGHLGQHVTVAGTADPTGKSVHIAKVTVLKNQGDQSKPSEMDATRP